MCSVCRSYNPVITSSFTTYHRSNDDWIIITTNRTHVTPVIDRERVGDDWIITTTNRTHVTPVIGLCSVCRSYNPVITSSFTTYHWYVPFVVVIIQSSLPLLRPISGVTCVPFVLVIIQSWSWKRKWWLDYSYDKRNTCYSSDRSWIPSLSDQPTDNRTNVTSSCYTVVKAKTGWLGHEFTQMLHKNF
jgi:hypothetical protein